LLGTASEPPIRRAQKLGCEELGAVIVAGPAAAPMFRMVRATPFRRCISIRVSNRSELLADLRASNSIC